MSPYQGQDHCLPCLMSKRQRGSVTMLRCQVLLQVEEGSSSLVQVFIAVISTITFDFMLHIWHDDMLPSICRSIKKTFRHKSMTLLGSC